MIWIVISNNCERSWFHVRKKWNEIINHVNLRYWKDPSFQFHVSLVCAWILSIVGSLKHTQVRRRLRERAIERKASEQGSTHVSACDAQTTQKATRTLPLNPHSLRWAQRRPSWRGRGSVAGILEMHSRHEFQCKKNWTRKSASPKNYAPSFRCCSKLLLTEILKSDQAAMILGYQIDYDKNIAGWIQRKQFRSTNSAIH